ncbi:hypothetical protein [Halomonas denitrificans]|uniref:hypothetical protein n=1 Tax=Halomonas denitrificans TaxID=370769 RepID=UPI001300AB2C|nr:hypothetical protein [Halomonas denitrificans]
MDLIHAAFEDCPDVSKVVQSEADGGFRFLKVNGAFVEATGFARYQVENARLEAVLPSRMPKGWHWSTGGVLPRATPSSSSRLTQFPAASAPGMFFSVP